MRHLISKLLAGGLAAGVILVWWPLVFPSDSVASWLVRGVLWTLVFELMVHAFMPLEESLWRTRTAHRVARQAQAASARLGTASPRTRFHGRWVVAGVALVVPTILLASAPSQPLSPRPAVANVRQVTQVRRIVRIERRSVRVPVPVVSGATQRAAAVEAAPAPSWRGVAAASPRRAASAAPKRGSTPSAPTKDAVTPAPPPTDASDESGADPQAAPDPSSDVRLGPDGTAGP